METRTAIRSLIVTVSGLLVIFLPGCAIRNVGPAIQTGASDTQRFPAAIDTRVVQDYRITPFDTLAVSVFQEPDLSARDVQVDAAGRVNLALVGEVAASGKTATELSRELEQLYGARYLVRPQVTVSLTTSASQKLVVQGEVRTPGVFDVKGSTTLLSAISLAQGETEVAALRQVVVLRTIDGQRMGALFDVESIRRGEEKDPAIFGNDVVVVGYHNARGLWRDLLRAVPVFSVFTPIR